MRLIDADAVLKWFDEYWAMQKKLGRPSKQQRAIYMTMRTMVNSVKTEDAVPVRHGKNVGTDYDETDQFICSECGIELQGWYRVERDDYDGEETHHEYRLRYCPNCGARMDEE